MNVTRSIRNLLLGLALLLMVALGALSGCSSGGSSGTGITVPPAADAKQAYSIALSAVSTVAPDGKLLVCQTRKAITASATPSWDFLIGSPKTDDIYTVLVDNGKAQFSTYGKAGLTATQWAEVPRLEAWKIDSNAAHEKAVAVYPNGKDAAYFAGFVTYVPQSATTPKDMRAMRWILSFDPASKGSAPTSTVDVDLTTGAAALAQ